MHLSSSPLILLFSMDLGLAGIAGQDFGNFEEENSFCDAKVCKGCDNISYIQWYEGCGE